MANVFSLTFIIYKPVLKKKKHLDTMKTLLYLLYQGLFSLLQK